MPTVFDNAPECPECGKAMEYAPSTRPARFGEAEVSPWHCPACRLRSDGGAATADH